MSRIAFKHVVGTAVGAMTVGTLIAGVCAYRRMPLAHTIQGFAGGAIVGAISVVGIGDEVYDKAAKDVHDFTWLVGRLRSKHSPDRQR